MVLTVFDDDRRVFEAICAGASGYLLKKTPAPCLIEGIRDAAEGGVPMSPEFAARVIALFRHVLWVIKTESSARPVKKRHSIVARPWRRDS